MEKPLNIEAADTYRLRTTTVRALEVAPMNLERLRAIFGMAEISGDVLRYNLRGRERMALVGSFMVFAEDGRVSVIDAASFLRDFAYIPPTPMVSEGMAAQVLDAIAGRNLRRRFVKLAEEFDELMTAARPVLARGSITEEERAPLLEELSDVWAVLFHIGSILGTTPAQMLGATVQKLEARKSDPAARRSHPHVDTIGCETCTHGLLRCYIERCGGFTWSRPIGSKICKKYRRHKSLDEEQTE